jgi:hypothetical protein
LPAGVFKVVVRAVARVEDGYELQLTGMDRR